MLLRIFLATALIPLSFGATPFVEKLQAEFEKRLTVKTLKNGLTVMIYEKHDAPIVSTSIGFKVGSVDEHAGNFGCAHMLEHMLFKGNRIYGTTDFQKESEITRQIEKWAARFDEEQLRENPDPTVLKIYKKRIEQLVKRLNEVVVKSPYNPIYAANGGKGLNAYTNTDNTVYIVDIPSNKLELWALLESMKFRDPVLRSYYPERDVVMEERRMRTDSKPRGKLWEALMGTSYMAHNYRNPIIGYMSELKTLKKETLTKFFKDYYAPNNCTMVLVGDVYPEKAIALIERYFGNWEPSERIERTHIREPEQEGERTAKVVDKAQPYLYASYHMPRLNTPDGTALTMLAQVLSGGKTSRFYQEIIVKQQLATSAWAYAGAGGQRYPGLFLVGGGPKHPHQPDELMKSMAEIIDDLVKNGVTQEELERVKTQTKAEFIYSLESASTVTSLLLSNHVNLGDWKEIFWDLERLLTLQPEDIVRVAKKYLHKDNRTVTALLTAKKENS